MKHIAREAESVILQLKAENRGKWRLQTEDQLKKSSTAITQCETMSMYIKLNIRKRRNCRKNWLGKYSF